MSAAPRPATLATLLQLGSWAPWWPLLPSRSAEPTSPSSGRTPTFPGHEHSSQRLPSGQAEKGLVRGEEARSRVQLSGDRQQHGHPCARAQALMLLMNGRLIPEGEGP